MIIFNFEKLLSTDATVTGRVRKRRRTTHNYVPVAGSKASIVHDEIVR